MILSTVVLLIKNAINKKRRSALCIKSQQIESFVAIFLIIPFLLLLVIMIADFHVVGGGIVFAQDNRSSKQENVFVVDVKPSDFVSDNGQVVKLDFMVVDQEDDFLLQQEHDYFYDLQMAIYLSYHLESSCGKKLVGDNGNAIGPFHTWKIVVDDVNRILRKQSFVYADRWNFSKSRDLFYIYLTYWGDIYKQKTGKEPTVETYLRMWNKGPNGWKDPKSLHYWQKARRLIQQ